MPAGTILTGDSAYTLKTLFPNDWKSNATVKVTITNEAGTALVTTQDATTYTADTVSVGVAKGRREFILTTGNALVAGQQIKVGSDAKGFHEYEVDDYTAGTKTVKVTRGLKEAVIAGDAVRGLDISYAVDASGATWTDVSRVYVKWIPTGDDIPFTEEWLVRSVRTDIGGLEESFAKTYKTIYSAMSKGDFPEHEHQARQELALELRVTQSRDMDLIVDGSLLKKPIMIQIAINAGLGQDLDEVMWNRLMDEKRLYLEMLDRDDLWQDTNEDGSKDEGETGPAPSLTFVRRNIF